jgi:hypothetical protein
VTSDESLASDESSPVKSHAPDVAAAAANDHNGDMVTRSRKGVVRNTDSFFKDDSVETKKISLTPRLLRGDSEGSANPTDQDARQRPSLETFDKTLGPEEKGKDDKKKKEKKGMLSGLFKRKDKAPKTTKGEGEESDKVSEDSIGLSPPSKDSLDSPTKVEGPPERRPSKLQKQPPGAVAKLSPVDSKPFPRDASPTSTTSIPHPTAPAPAPPTLQPLQTGQQPRPRDDSSTSPTSPQPQNRSPTHEKKSIFAPISTVLKPSSVHSSFEQQEPVAKPIYSKRAKKRFAIDDSDSEDDRTPTTDHHGSSSPVEPSDDYAPRTDSPAPVSPVELTQEKQQRLHIHATSSVGDNSHSNTAPRSESRTSPAHVADSDEGTTTTKASPSLDAPTPSTSRSTPTWSDASLRSYMDNDQGIKELLIIIHDSSNVNPVGPDHPLMGNLFVNERTRLAEMQSNLDAMLTNWVAKKNAMLLSR